MSSVSRFSPKWTAEIDAIKYFRIRAGDEHKFIAVWVVVVDGRVCVRSWNDKPTGWYRAFLKEKRGAVQIGKREVAVRGVPVRSARLREAMDAAYAAKYASKANRPYVLGFRTRTATMEFVPV